MNYIQALYLNYNVCKHIQRQQTTSSTYLRSLHQTRRVKSSSKAFPKIAVSSMGESPVGGFDSCFHAGPPFTDSLSCTWDLGIWDRRIITPTAVAIPKSIYIMPNIPQLLMTWFLASPSHLIRADHGFRLLPEHSAPSHYLDQILIYCQLDHEEQSEILLQIRTFSSEKMLLKNVIC